MLILPVAHDSSGPGRADVLQPGGPGEGNATISPEDAETAVEPELDEADVAVMQMMVPHHAQAIVMAELAEKHARSDRVRELAARIRAAQGPEILMMSAWLDERDMAVPTAAEDPSEWDPSHSPRQPRSTARPGSRVARPPGSSLCLADVVSVDAGRPIPTGWPSLRQRVVTTFWADA